MPRVIFKCPYIKGGSEGAAAHLGNYVRYMATREGAQRIAPGKADLPATKKQRDMVEKLLHDFPLSRGMFEYEDYLAAPTRGNASEFITRALEDNYDQIAKRENYVSYIASRPRAQRTGTHALFTGTDETLVLSQIADEVAHHPGNVWLPIISLRREDAARLGYDNAENWRELLAGYAVEMAAAMKIPWEQFRWYAAFHDESHHPHVHMVCYSADGKSGFLTKDGIAQIKSGLAKQIFHQELHELYVQQTQRRDGLTQEAGKVMAELIQRMQTGTLENPRIEQLMQHLAGKLKNVSGKKQYGYLKAPLKAVVDEVVDELAKEPSVAAAYALWYELREEVLRTYRDDLPQRLPLSQQETFKRIKNLVIQEAVQLGEADSVFAPTEEEVEDEPRPAYSSPQDQSARRVLSDPAASPEQVRNALKWLTAAAEAGQNHAQYALGKLYRDGGPVEKNRLRAVIWFCQAAEQGNEYAMYALGKLYLEENKHSAALRWFRKSAELGNPYAQYALGKLYLLGKEIPRDQDAAVRWFTLSAAQGNKYAQYFLDHINDFRGPSILSCAARLLRHMSRIFQDQVPKAPSRGIAITDRKLRRRIQEKKMAMGHKADDHADEGIKMQ